LLIFHALAITLFYIFQQNEADRYELESQDSQSIDKMAKCTKCGVDIQSGGYDTEELKLPNATCYLVSCKQCKTVLGIVQE
jgi:hypothetical protein